MPLSEVDREAHGRDSSGAVREFASWYRESGIDEPGTAAIVDDLLGVLPKHWASRTPESRSGRTPRPFAESPTACGCTCRTNVTVSEMWRAKGKWKNRSEGPQVLSASDLENNVTQQVLQLYEVVRRGVRRILQQSRSVSRSERFIAEFDVDQGSLYRDYKRDAALLDFDDLLYQARGLLRDHEPVRKALAARYSHVLVDEFQDTDPLQAEIIWRLGCEGSPQDPWQDRAIRPGALFLVGDPKQAIYRFRGADVQTYLTARRALSARATPPRS